MTKNIFTIPPSPGSLWTIKTFDMNGGIGILPFIQKRVLLVSDPNDQEDDDIFNDQWPASPGDVLLATGNFISDMDGLYWCEVLFVDEHDQPHNLWAIEKEAKEFFIPL